MVVLAQIGFVDDGFDSGGWLTYGAATDVIFLVDVCLGLWATTLIGRKHPHIAKIYDLVTSKKSLVFPGEYFDDLIEILEGMSFEEDQEKKESLLGLTNATGKQQLKRRVSIITTGGAAPTTGRSAAPRGDHRELSLLGSDPPKLGKGPSSTLLVVAQVTSETTAAVALLVRWTRRWLRRHPGGGDGYAERRHDHGRLLTTKASQTSLRSQTSAGSEAAPSPTATASVRSESSAASGSRRHSWTSTG